MLSSSFNYRKEHIIPLWTGITGEIIKDLKIHPDHHQTVKRAICYYQSWNSYLQSLAFPKVKYGLWKEVKQKTTSTERNQAREILINYGHLRLKMALKEGNYTKI